MVTLAIASGCGGRRLDEQAPTEPASAPAMLNFGMIVASYDPLGRFVVRRFHLGRLAHARFGALGGEVRRRGGGEEEEEEDEEGRSRAG